MASALPLAVEVAPDLDAFTGGLEVGIYAAFAVIAALIGIAAVRRFLSL